MRPYGRIKAEHPTGVAATRFRRTQPIGVDDNVVAGRTIKPLHRGHLGNCQDYEKQCQGSHLIGSFAATSGHLDCWREWQKKGYGAVLSGKIASHVRRCVLALLPKQVRSRCRNIITFAEVIGDRNPVHLDAAYAATTPFKTPIAHGMLTAGYISTVFGMHLPGPGAIYVSQTQNFRDPVRQGDHVVASVRIVDLIAAKKRARFVCLCRVGDRIVLEGETILMVPGQPAVAAD